jgi:hypothetical protein
VPTVLFLHVDEFEPGRSAPCAAWNHDAISCSVMMPSPWI